jgi:hypothetical protein
MDGFTTARVAEARELIAAARRRVDAERMLIAQVRAAAAQTRLLLRHGRHFDLDRGRLR